MFYLSKFKWFYFMNAFCRYSGGAFDPWSSQGEAHFPNIQSSISSVQNCSRRLLQRRAKRLLEPQQVQLLAGIRLLFSISNVSFENSDNNLL